LDAGAVVQVRALLEEEAVDESEVVDSMLREDLTEAIGRRRKRIDWLSDVPCS
jgi:hypothetical protein